MEAGIGWSSLLESSGRAWTRERAQARTGKGGYDITLSLGGVERS